MHNPKLKSHEYLPDLQHSLRGGLSIIIWRYKKSLRSYNLISFYFLNEKIEAQTY